MPRITAIALMLVIGVGGAALADIPMVVNHQGMVKVNGVPFTGTGFFKFGLVNDAGNYVWTNDGTRLATAATASPVDSVTLSVTNGSYSVRLGDAAITNMVAIPATVFNDNDVQLRVYFNDGVNGEVGLAPDQPVTAVPYAFHAHTADTVPGFVTGGLLSNDETDATNSLHVTDLICRDDQNTANIEVAAMSKRVDATWAAGDGNGGLDADTIGSTQVLVYVWAIGDSTGENTGDILFSKSGVTPGLPTGYDVKRFIGARLWASTKWQTFLSVGGGRTRQVIALGPSTVGPIPLVATLSQNGVAETVDVSSVVPAGRTRLVQVHYRAERDSTDLLQRASCAFALSQSGGVASQTLMGEFLHVSTADQTQVQSIQWIPITADGTFAAIGQWYPSSVTALRYGGVQLYLHAYIEDL